MKPVSFSGGGHNVPTVQQHYSNDQLLYLTKTSGFVDWEITSRYCVAGSIGESDGY